MNLVMIMQIVHLLIPNPAIQTKIIDIPQIIHPVHQEVRLFTNQINNQMEGHRLIEASA